MLKRAEQGRDAAQSLAEDLCATFDPSGACVVVTDDALCLRAANSVANALLEEGWAGYELDPALEPDLASAVRRALATGRAVRLELHRFPRSGLAGSWDVECLPVGGETPVGVLISMRDDGERQALRRELERANRSESLGRLAGSIAHDFNNLLTGIRGSLALASQNRSKESHDTALRAADLAAQRAAEMTRQLLAFSRGPAYVPPRADANTVLTEAAELLSCLPDGARVELDLSPGLGKVDVTTAELHQIALNLLMNARDAVRSLGPRGRVSLSATRCAGPPQAARGVGCASDAPVSSERPTRWLRVSVADNGPGIAPTARKQIFEPFFTTKPGHEGTGLGLSSVREIVERAGGWIDVQSELEQGATFDVYLPLLTEGFEMKNLVRTEQRPKERDQILICDDETRLASLTAGLLEEFGFASTAVDAGEDALRHMRSRGGGVDVLLLDVNLNTGVTAEDILNTMSDEGLDAPVILTSGFAQEDVPKGLCTHPRVSSYLAKPYTVSELVAAINRALEARVTRRAARHESD